MRTEQKAKPFVAGGLLALAALIANPTLFAHGDESHAGHAAESKAVRIEPAHPKALAALFSQALAAGDPQAVEALLLPDVLIFESGGAETSATEYAGHHLPADMAFLSNLKSEQQSQVSGGEGSSAWVATRSRLRGSYKDKPVDLDSTETLVMRLTAAGWRIAHIHWSSAPHREGIP